MAPVKIALLGCGDVAQRDYLPELHRLRGRAEIVAVCGRTPDRARSVADEYDIRDWYTDYHQMLDETDAEAIVNLTPIQLHGETNLAALQAGRHVYTEKPAAASVAEAWGLRDVAQQRRLKLVCAPCVQLFPQVRRARQILDDGTIGRVHLARGLGHGGVPPWEGYTSDPSQFFARGGGPARDMGVYPLHALTGLLGPVRRVTAMTAQAQRSFVVPDGPAEGTTIRIEEPDSWQMLLDLGEAGLASIDANNVVQGTRAPQLELFGLEGTLAINLLDVSAPIQLFSHGEWKDIAVEQSGRASGPDHLLGIEHLVECIANDAEPVLSIEHALHVIDIIETAARSAAEGRTYEVTGNK